MPITNTSLTQVRTADNVQRSAMIFSTSAYTTTSSFADIPGSDFDAFAVDTLGITVVNSGANSLTFQVLGGNLPDFSDAVVVGGPTAVAAGASGSYTTFFAPFRYYKTQAKDTAGGSHGIAVVNVLGRPA